MSRLLVREISHFTRIDVERHIDLIRACQRGGGWKEFLTRRWSRGENMAPQATAQAILGLLPYLDTPGVSAAIEEGCKALLSTQSPGHGWADYSSGAAIVDASGACISALCQALEATVLAGPVVVKTEKAVARGIRFILSQQNGDGGWGLLKGATSNLLCSYYALRALSSGHVLSRRRNCSVAALRFLGSYTKQLDEDSETDIIELSYAVLCTNILSPNAPLDKLRRAVTNNCWQPLGRAVTMEFRNVRRVYVLSDMGVLLGALMLLEVPPDHAPLRRALFLLRKCDHRLGLSYDGDIPCTWFAAQILSVLPGLAQYLKKWQRTLDSGVHRRLAPRKIALYIGRFRPPHRGHYDALRGIVNLDEGVFEQPEQALRILASCDRLIIGVARLQESKSNPLSAGAVREIWRAIISGDPELVVYNGAIEVLPVSAKRDFANIVGVAHEITLGADRLVVCTGNSRVASQCGVNKVQCLKLRRGRIKVAGKAISGTLVRDLVQRLGESMPARRSATLEARLRASLHPAAYKFMSNNNLFSRMRGVLTEK
ncbi:MAG: hypothetical protein IMZ50_01200 [Candidatus Atribacteria bacterium]|nr:hypothetical protein [Planctomycetota bacterium]MBE3117356.1 hypothetical protein [Candidatus Atribacteria bacterium]